MPAPIEIESARSRPRSTMSRTWSPASHPPIGSAPTQLTHYLSSNPQSVLLVARRGTEAVGAATVGRSGRPGHQYTMVRVVSEALKSAQIAWARQAGIERLVTSNDAPNAAMLAVNRRLGYRVVSGGVLVEGPERLG